MIEELYTASIRSSNLRCETRDGTPIRHIDVVTAFGMSRSSMGLALLRLHTESCATIELLLQYRRKLATGEKPVLTLETQHILARLEDGAFMPTTH